jgi:cell division septal protein FtsQ
MARRKRGNAKNGMSGRAITEKRKSAPQAPQPVRERRPRPAEGHAPVYDQDEGRLGTAVEMPAQNAARRQKNVHRRMTKAEMRRRKLRRRLATGILIFAVIAAGIVLSVLLLFKVNKYEVQNLDGTTPADTGVYSEDQIISSLNIKKGANLFSFRAGDKVSELNAAFPLLENIEIRRRLPDTVIVRIQPAVESYCIQTDTGWAVISRHLKVISVAGDQPQLPVLLSAVSTAPQQGQALLLDTPETLDALNQLLDALDSAGMLSDITEINFNDMTEVSFVYQGRIRVKLGTIYNLDYKMKWADYILLNQNGDGCSQSDAGILDVSHLRNDGTIRPTFAQGDPNAEPTPAPEEPPADSAASNASSAPSASQPAA